MTPHRKAQIAATTALLSLVVFTPRAFAQMPPQGSAGTAPPTGTVPMDMPSSGKPPLSPPASAVALIEGRDVKITYNAPSMRGRKIMGGLVPYDKVWRTGANAATTFYTEDTLKVGDLTVKAGTYTLYTLPGAPGKPWKLIVNKQTGQWGTVYDEKQDLGRTDMQAATLATPQEVMSISFEKRTKSDAELHIRWETTDVWVKLQPPPTEMMFVPKKRTTEASAIPPAKP